jgi:hypothetical protein
VRLARLTGSDFLVNNVLRFDDRAADITERFGISDDHAILEPAVRVISRLVGGCAAVAALLSTGVVPAVAAQPETTQTVTISWLGEAGQVTKTWSGSPAEAAVINSQLLTAERSAISRFATPNINATPDINSYPCHSDDWQVYNSGELCFVNSGNIEVQIYSVLAVDSGNNIGYFQWYNGAGGYFKQPMAKKGAEFVLPYAPDPYPEVYYIHIN